MFSVVIPVYNRRALVGRAIRSVLAQQGADFEVIVVDDASDDGTPEQVREEFGSAVKIVILAENSGVSAARNRGIAAAEGEWIALLDSDDEWLPNKLARQAESLHESGLLVCHTDEIWIRNGVRINPHQTPPEIRRRHFLQSLALVCYVAFVDCDSPPGLCGRWYV